MKNKGISRISIIVLVFILIVIVALGIMLVNKKRDSYDKNKEKSHQSNSIVEKSNDFDDKKKLIDELNNKFYKENNSNNYYILNDYGSWKVEVFVLDDKAKTRTTWYKTDTKGNIDKNVISMTVETIIIGNLQYYYRDNRDNTPIIKKIYKMDEKIDTKEAWINYIYPSKKTRQYMSNEELKQNIEKFINDVKIERNNNTVILSLNNRLDFFDHTVNYDAKKVLKIDFITGAPILLTVENTDHTLSTINFKYKLNCCIENDFDISKFQGVQISE